ncbi:DUF58 domain-containing protein, partial [Pseudomonas aeruginosa]
MRLRNWPRWQRWLNRRIPPASSVELNQRRVFILPTRQGGAFGLALLVMLLAAINYQNSLAYGLTFLLLSLGVVTILHTYRNLAGLRLTALGADPVFAGERAGFRVRLESPRRVLRHDFLYRLADRLLALGRARRAGAHDLLAAA